MIDESFYDTIVTMIGLEYLPGCHLDSFFLLITIIVMEKKYRTTGKNKNHHHYQQQQQQQPTNLLEISVCVFLMI